MSQEENREILSSDKSAADSIEENSNLEEITTILSEQTDSEEVDNLPIGSIGSYARIDELVSDEDTEISAESASET